MAQPSNRYYIIQSLGILTCRLRLSHPTQHTEGSHGAGWAATLDSSAQIPPFREKSPTSWDSRFFSFLFSSCSLSWVPGTPCVLCKEAGPPSQPIFQTLTSHLLHSSLQKNSYANTTACLYFHTLIFRLG